MDNMKETIEELWLEYRSHTHSVDAWQFKEWLIKKINNMKNIHRINGNIYITSDEEIKEGVDQWYLDKVLNKHYNSGGAQYSSKQDVIILTTDQDLIKDGVQKIDDEFLEWFVENPSCEEVKVEKEYLSNNGVWKEVLLPSEWEVDTKVRHKTIIPKEEPKQETIEEASREYYKKGQLGFEAAADTEKAFLKGAKWQAERMYSEEDLLSAFEAGMMFIGEDKGSFNEWFEQFKKK